MDAYQNLISGDKSPLDGHNGCSQYFSSQVINSQHCQRREKNNVKRRVEIDTNAGITIGGYLPPVNCPPEYASAERL